MTASEILGPIDKMTSLSEMTSTISHEKCVTLGPLPMLIIFKSSVLTEFCQMIVWINPF